MHLVDDPLHHLDGAARPGHDAGAQRRQVVPRPPRLLEHRDEHRGNPVDRGAAGFGHCPQGLRRIEAFAGKHHRRALGHAAERAHHHAEAVIQRHRNAQPIVLGEPDTAGDEAGVVDDVVVGQRRALRRAGGVGGELDVDRIVGAEGAGHRLEPQRLRRSAEAADVVEAEDPRTGVGAYGDDDPELRQPGGGEAPGLAAFQLRRQLPNHVDVPRGLERLGRDQCLAPHGVQRVLQLPRTVGGVDVDEHRAEARGGVLGQNPLQPVGGPDTDTIPLPEAQREQTGRKGFHLPVEVVVAQGSALLRQHHGVARTVAGDRLPQGVGYGGVAQRRALLAGHVGPALPQRAEVRFHLGTGRPREPAGQALGQYRHRSPPLRHMRDWSSARENRSCRNDITDANSRHSRGSASAIG